MAWGLVLAEAYPTRPEGIEAQTANVSLFPICSPVGRNVKYSVIRGKSIFSGNGWQPIFRRIPQIESFENGKTQ